MPIATKEAMDRKNAKRKAARAAANHHGPMKPNRMTTGRRCPVIDAMSKAQLREMLAEAVRNTAIK